MISVRDTLVAAIWFDRFCFDRLDYFQSAPRIREASLIARPATYAKKIARWAFFVTAEIFPSSGRQIERSRENSQVVVRWRLNIIPDNSQCDLSRPGFTHCSNLAKIARFRRQLRLSWGYKAQKNRWVGALDEWLYLLSKISTFRITSPRAMRSTTAIPLTTRPKTV
jgi:hypothetical protein